MSQKGAAKRSAPTPHNKWQIDFTGRSSRSLGAAAIGDKHISPYTQTDLAAPPGYSTDKLALDVTAKDQDGKLVVKKAWDVALAPLKQVPMNMFVMWMSGNSISIFPIMMVGMMFVRPIQALFSASQAFKQIEGDQAVLQKLVWMLGHVACMFLALYKCNIMGLLPTHSSDWLAFVQPQRQTEFSSGGFSFL